MVTVGRGKDYATITQALEHVPDGGTVEIYSGRYTTLASLSFCCGVYTVFCPLPPADNSPTFPPLNRRRYAERLVITRPVTIAAAAGDDVELAWSTQSPYEATIEVDASLGSGLEMPGAVALRGLRLRHSSPSIANNYAVHLVVSWAGWQSARIALVGGRLQQMCAGHMVEQMDDGWRLWASEGGWAPASIDGWQQPALGAH